MIPANASRHCTLAAMALATLLPAAARAADPSGAWRGTYVCYQGVTALDLTLVREGPRGLRGEFHFTAAPSNPAVPEGCFTMTGTFDPTDGHVRLNPGRWLLQPMGYVMIGLDGRIDPSGASFEGGISPPVPGCTTFSLRAADTSPAAPAACHPAATTVSLSGPIQ